MGGGLGIKGKTVARGETRLQEMRWREKKGVKEKEKRELASPGSGLSSEAILFANSDKGGNVLQRGQTSSQMNPMLGVLASTRRYLYHKDTVVAHFVLSSGQIETTSPLRGGVSSAAGQDRWVKFTPDASLT